MSSLGVLVKGRQENSEAAHKLDHVVLRNFSTYNHATITRTGDKIADHCLCIQCLLKEPIENTLLHRLIEKNPKAVSASSLILKKIA